MSDADILRNQLQYQTRAFLELSHTIQTQKIANAWLFFGNEHTGKRNAALFLVKGLNCLNSSQDPCNTCTSCRKIDAGSHPDILRVDLEKEKKNITIRQIRQLGLQLGAKINEARFRMALVLNADKINIQAQNALLKMLEEPPGKTFFVLIASAPDFLRPTILSRCRKIRFRPMTVSQIEDTLINEFNINRDMAHISARTADTDLEKAKRYLNLTSDPQDTGKRYAPIDWIQRRQYLLESLSQMIVSAKNKGLTIALMLSRELGRDVDTLSDAIAIMKTFIRDMLICKHDKEKLINLDFSGSLKQMHSMVGSDILIKWLETLFEAEKKIASNSHPRLVMDSCFLKIIQEPTEEPKQYD